MYVFALSSERRAMEQYEYGEKAFYIDLDEMGTYENRVRMCYAFLSSPSFYYQEIAIYNMHPKEFDPEYIVPRDAYSFTHLREKGKRLPSLNTVLNAARREKAPITCIGSHKLAMDRTIMLAAMPGMMDNDPEVPGEHLLLIRFIGDVPEEEQDMMIDNLIRAYASLPKE